MTGTDGVGGKLGKYTVVRRLATGGMGEVYLARHDGPAGFSKPVVLKRVLPHLAREPQFIQMFLDEARLAAILAHPNIVQIHELGEDAGTWFIAMEFLDGRSLRAIRDRVTALKQPMDPVQAARMVSQALDGLHYAHTLTNDAGQPLNIVHRDVSPDNVFVGFNGAVKVLDFGIAKAANAIASTKTGMVKGKAAFMPPEQLLANPLDGRTDVYAAGVVLYELLCGVRPFTAPTDAALIHQIITQPPEPLKPRAPHVPEALCAVVMKALSKAPANRYATAAEFSTALERFVAASGVPNTNAQTAAWMKHLFEAQSTPAPAPVTAVPLRPETTAFDDPSGAPTQPVERKDFARESGLFEAPSSRRAASLMEGTPAPRFERDEALTSLADDKAASAAAPVPVQLSVVETLELARPVATARPPEAPRPALPRARSRAPLLAGVGLVLVLAVGGALGYPRWVASRTMKLTVPDVVFVSEPAGAALRIGSEDVGVTPWAASNAWVGEVPWELSAPGHQKRKGTFKGGTPARFDVKLQKK